MFSFCSKFKQKRGFTTRNQHTGLGPAVTPEFIYKSDVKRAMYLQELNRPMISSMSIKT